MKHKKLQEIPARTREVIDRVNCDLCGAVIPDDNGYTVDQVTSENVTCDVFRGLGRLITPEELRAIWNR